MADAAQRVTRDSDKPGWMAALRRRVMAFLRSATRRALQAGERLPFGVRSLAGVALVVGGCFGFLPILGFWMIPSGIAILSLDFPPLHRRILRWLDG